MEEIVNEFYERFGTGTSCETNNVIETKSEKSLVDRRQRIEKLNAELGTTTPICR